MSAKKALRVKCRFIAIALVTVPLTSSLVFVSVWMKTTSRKVIVRTKSNW